MNKLKVVVIGSGFSSLTAAICLADSGFRVTILEKNDTAGGRARQFSEKGFTFDMGPSWYWMPDVFEQFFKGQGTEVSDLYQLLRLDPSYRVFFGKDDITDIPASYRELKSVFDSIEPGSGKRLDEFLEQAKYKYQSGMNNLVYKPGRSLFEYLDTKVLLGILKLDIFQSFHRHLRKFFKHSKILRLLEFPVLFLGALPENTPALYSLMNYADIKLGTWYPQGGMHRIVEALVGLAQNKGVEFKFNQCVKEIVIEQKRATKVVTETDNYPATAVVAGADYHHVEKELLPLECRSYKEKYWEQRVMAPSSLIFYLGISKKLDNLKHHNLFFDRDFEPHAREIYQNPRWPSDPLFYVSVTSKTDPSVCPPHCENLFILIPVATDLEDGTEIREKYYIQIMERLEALTNQSIRDHVVFKKSYAHKDFVSDYNAFKGNAYGLANTLKQTALLKPSMKSKKVTNLFFTGQLTVPGPGVPPAIISGQVAAHEVYKEFKTKL
ncbi:MAG: phytoene desaturase family protein [Cyclobacteriaceae bacterium]